MQLYVQHYITTACGYSPQLSKETVTIGPYHHPKHLLWEGNNIH